MLKLLNSKISNYQKSGYYLVLLLLLAFAGFWKTYFSLMIQTNQKFEFYFHFHALVMIMWVLMLIIQPLLIYYKKRNWHRIIGQYSYFHMPLLFFAAVLLIDHGIFDKPFDRQARSLFVSFKDLVVIGLAYGMAIYHRKDRLIHARYMICTSFAFIEPALARIAPYYVVGIVVVSLILFLMYKDRKYPKGQRVFIPFLLLYLFFQWYLQTGAQFGFMESFRDWFVTLKLTS